MPLLLPAAAWVMGLAAARCDQVNWPIMFGLGAAASFLLFLQIGSKPKSPVLLAAALLLAGILWGWAGLLHDARRIDVDATWLNTPLELAAKVAEIQQQADYSRLTLSDVRRTDGARLHGDIWLYTHAHRDSEAWRPLLLPGDRIEVRARLHAPRNQRNPSGFDFAAWCFDHHIALLGGADGEVRRTAYGATWLEMVRQRIRQELALLPQAQGGVIRALLLGERGMIPEHINDAFAATGAAHLLAISGLHIGLLAGLGFALCWLVLTRREVWIVNLPVRGLAMLGGVLLALAYAQLAGWPLPTQRAAIMLAAAAIAWWLRANTSPLNTLLAALMLILFFDPSALGSLSLWLSFVATMGILLWAGTSAGHEASSRQWGKVLRRWAIGLLLVTLVASLVTLPLVAHVFGRLPTYSLPANLLLTPLYTLFILPLSLLGAVLVGCGLDSGAHTLFALAGCGVELGNRLLLRISAWPAGHLWLPAIPLWLDAAYMGGMAGAALLLYRSRRVMSVALLMLTLAAYVAAASREGPPAVSRFIAWDVGQGAASSLILPGGRVMVIDAAGRPGSRFNAGTTMADGLRGMGLTHVDVLLITHAQSDHDGGALSLLHHVNRIGELWLADVPEMHLSQTIDKLCRAAIGQGGRVRWLQQGDHLDFAPAAGKVLWPPRGYAAANANNTSLVLQLRLPSGQRLLLDGDIESPAERLIVTDQQRQALASDVMLMPHHGSKTSSSPAFLAAIHPRLAIAQTGFDNRYGFPAPVVLARYRALGSRISNTADGAVVVDFASDGGFRLLEVMPVGSEKRKLALQWWRHLL
jgi:competence protein ComEC